MEKKLYLIPTPIRENGLADLPTHTMDIIRSLDTFIVENARTARRFIKTCEPPLPIQELNIIELDKHAEDQDQNYLAEALKHADAIGLMSEAGCPAVADPGHLIVRQAHDLNMKIVPLIGPSSILLALMASGMNGQQFQFHGYLSAKKELLPNDLRKLEKLSRSTKATQLFIEAPYRNTKLLESAFKVLDPNTFFCLAANVGAADQYIKTAKIKDWRRMDVPNVHKVPALFLLQS